jgi:prepilin-type N-terminal cleavage/methylation domain-containing protein
MHKPTVIHRPDHRQHGFSLLELSIALVIMVFIVMGLIAMQVDQAQSDKARAVAQTYNRMNTAVGSYLTNFYDRLVKLKPECATPNWASQGGIGAPTPDYSGCALTTVSNNNVVQLAVNGLQPTPQELVSLGFLATNSQPVDVLPLDTIWDHAGNSINFASSLGRWVMGTNNNALPSRFMVLIQQLCIVPGQGQPVVVTASGGCASNSVDLRSLVFNSHPYDFVGLNQSTVLDRALIAIGADGYLSDSSTTGGELRALNGAVEATITNPSRFIAQNQGAPNILAIRNGYGSSGWDQFVRRDGSTTMTSDWNYGNTNIQNVNNMAVNNNATIGNVVPDSTNGAGGTGSLTVNGVTTMGTDAASKDGSQVLNVKGGTNISGDTTVGGALTASTGVFGKIVNQLAAALQAASAYVEGFFTVGGPATFNGSTTTNGPLNVNGGLTTPANSNAVFNGPVDLKGPTNIYKFKLNAEDTFGAPCDPAVETIRKQRVDNSEKYKQGLRLLVCDSVTKVWVMPQPDLSQTTPVAYNPRNNLAGQYFVINYTSNSCRWVRGSPWDCVTGGAVPADPAEWDATVVAISGNGVLNSAHVDNKGSYYWLSLYFAENYVTADTHIKWTSKVAQPKTSPADLTQIGTHLPMTRDCTLDWLKWTYDATYNWGKAPEILNGCAVVDKSPGFWWTP